MKKYFVCALAALSFTACVNEDGLLSETKGYINLNVNADNEMVVTRAEQTVSDLSNWTIIIKKNGTPAASWSSTQVYAAGTDYSAEVYNYVDDNAAIAANNNWGAARYEGATSNTFKVEAGKTTNVEINCGKAKNTKLTVTFAEGFTKLEKVSDYNVNLTTRNLTFNQNNTTAEAFYAANQSVPYTLNYKYNNDSKTINGTVNTGEAGTATNIMVNANTNGTITLTIKYDDAWTQGTEQSITIDAATGEEVTNK